jgi:hypothetical protein
MASLENLIDQVGAQPNEPRADITARSTVTNAFQLPTGASSGYVLSSDAKGNASWVDVKTVGGTTATGTANQVLVNGTSGTPQTGALVFSAPQDLGPGSSVEFKALKLGDLTPNRLVYSDASDMLLSAAEITDWILGTANQVIVTDNKDGSVTLSAPQDIATGSSVEFKNITLGSSTGKRILSTNLSKQLVLTNLVDWITGTANQVIVTDNGDGSVTLSLPQSIGTGSSPTFTGLTLSNPLAITSGGTGRNSATAKTIPYIDGSGTWQFFTMTDGDLIIGSTGNVPSVAKLTAGSNVTITNAAGAITIASSGIGASSITGTANQVLVNGTSGSAQTGAITLTLPQSIGTGSTPTFSNINLSALGGSQYVKSGTGSGFTSVSTIPASDITGLSATAPMSYSSGTIALLYSATNLRNNGGNLDTIQGISSAASPQFTGLTLSSTGAGTFMGINNSQVGNSGPYLSFQKTRNFAGCNVNDIAMQFDNGAYIGVGSYTGFRMQTVVSNTGSPGFTTTFSSMGASTLVDLIQLAEQNIVFPSQTASRFLRTDASKNLISTAISTSDVPEGSNLYFTNARARSALSGSTNISYNSTSGVIDTVQGISTAGTPQFRQLYLDTQGNNQHTVMQMTNSTSGYNNFIYIFKNRTGGLNPGELIHQWVSYGYNSSNSLFGAFTFYTYCNSSTAAAETATTVFESMAGGTSTPVLGFVGSNVQLPTQTASTVLAVDSNKYITAANISSGAFTFTVSSLVGFATAANVTGRYTNTLNMISYNGTFTGTSNGSASTITFNIDVPVSNTGAWSNAYQATGTATASGTVSGSTAYVAGGVSTGTTNKISFTYTFSAPPTNATTVQFNFSLMYLKT